MKENSNWQIQQRQDKLRPAPKRFSYPYPQIVSAKQSPVNQPLNKKQFALLDKENFKTMDLRIDRKKTISPERKKSSMNKRRTKRTQPNQLTELNKTQQLRKAPHGKTLRVPSSGSHPDFIKGKSAQSKRQRRLEWENFETREMSLSLKKRSLSKELRKIIYQDHREKSRSKRPATELTKINTSLKPETIPLMRDILREIKKESDNVRPRKDSLVDSKKLKKDRKKSLETSIVLKKTEPLAKTINTNSSKLKIKKKRISTVIEDIKDIPNSQSQLYKQSLESSNIADGDFGEIEEVLLTEADEFDLNEFRQFENKYFKKDFLKQRLENKHPSSQLLDIMARKIQRWWRRQRTKSIVNQFIRFTNHTTSPVLSERLAKTESAESEQKIKQQSSKQQQLLFYEDSVRKITHISNLSNEQQSGKQEMKIQNMASVESGEQNSQASLQLQNETSAKFDSVIHHMKQKQLEKLNSFIGMIKQQLEKSNKVQTEELLKKLVEQSEFNCRSLEKEAQVALASKNQPAGQKQYQLVKEPEEHYEEIDEDYISKCGKSQEQSSILQQSQQVRKESPRIRQITEPKESKRPITPSLENYQKPKLQIDYQQKNTKHNEQRLTFENAAKINTLPMSALVRQRLVYDRTPSPNSQQKQEVHVLDSYEEPIQEDPLAGLQAAERLRKKLQELNSRTFQLQNQSDLLYNNSDEQESPPLKRQANTPLHRKSQDRELQFQDSSNSSDEWQAFPKLQKLLKIIPDKERISDDTTHFLLTHLLTEFLKQVGSSSIVKLFKEYAIKLRDRDKKVIVIKKAVYRKTKGIKTNVAAVKEFLKGFNMYIIEKRTELLERLREPAGPSAKELLKYMHPYEQESESEDDIGMLVLPVQLFDEYWAEYQKTFVFQTPQQTELERSQQDYLRRLTNIHCRAIFDCFNEGLNFERNFGEFGKPFPWKSVPNFDIKPTVATYKTKLQNAYLRTIEMATSYCGIIFDKQDAPSAIMPTREQMQQMHEDRLSRTLALELFEMERNWLFYDDEETEILVELGQKVMDFIMRECQHDLLRLFRLRAFS